MSLDPQLLIQLGESLKAVEGDVDAYPAEDEELKLVMEIFRAGLKNCSPKVLLTLMPLTRSIA